MILKYNSLEKDMYKRMFKADGNSSNRTISSDSNNNEVFDSFKANGNSLNDETKEYITNKLK